MSINPLITHINPNTSLYAAAGSGGGGSVSTFTTASISSLTVSSINGLPATNFDTADWSTYPAIQSVDMNGNLLRSAGPFAIGIGAPGLENTNAIFNANGSVSFLGDISATNASASVLSGVLVSTTTGQFNNVNTGSLYSATTIYGSNIVASTITANTVVALSTVNAISTLSTTIVDAGEVITDKLLVEYGTGTLEVSQAVAGGAGGMKLNAPSTSATVFTAGKTDGEQNYLTMGIGASDPNGFLLYNTSTIQRGEITFYESLSNVGLGVGGGIKLQAEGNNAEPIFITPSSLVASDISTATISASNINVSTINGNELIVSTIVLESTIQAEGGNFNQLTATAFSSIGAEIKQGLMSSIVFNPSISPEFNVDLGMGNFLTTLGTGLFGVAVGVPTLAGTATYGITKGLASLFEPKPNLNNIAVTNDYEVFNYASQLQVSTLGNQISTIYSFISTIPSTIVINDQPTNSTIDFCEQPFFFSTVSQSSNPTCIRAIADPSQTVSTPWNYSQSLPEWSWVEIPSGGLDSNVSTLSLSTLQLLPSTVLKGDLDGAVMEVIESATGNYGEVKSAGYWVTLSDTDPNFGIIARDSNNVPVWIDSNIVPNLFALQGKTVEFNTVSTVNISTASIDAFQIVTSNINVSTAVLQNLTINDGNYALSQNLINTEDGGALIATYSNIVSPTGIYTVIQNLDPNPVYRGNAFFNMSGEHSTIGVNKQGVPGYTLDVEGDMRAKIGHYSAVYASSLLAPSTFVEVQSYVGTVELTPNSAWWVSVNSGTVAGDAQGKIRFGISETETPGYNGTETYLGTKVYPGEYDGTSWTNYVGRPIRVEYSVLLDSSFPSGNGQAQFVLPIGFSTLQSCQITTVGFGDNNPGFNHPPWIYSTINDGNGLISTIQVAGEANVPVFVSALGYV